MKMNKWTLGLAALGLVSLAPGLLAADTAPAPVPVTTALSATTISGYVDTSAVWNPGTGNANPAPYAFNGGKQDGFNLDAVDVKIARLLDEGKASAGYTLELMAGPDATVGPWANVRQAYIALRANVGNGLDFKVGQWDNVLGYEGTDAGSNPNWSRSYGYTIEPTEHIGVLASYKFNDAVSAEVGVANEITAYQNRNVSATGIAPGPIFTPGTIESKKAIVSLVTLTAPDSWGSLKGSQLYAGLDYGPGDAFSHRAFSAHVVDKTELYVGATIMTPVKGLSAGASWDTINNSDLGSTAPAAYVVEGYASSVAAYLSYKVTDKLTLNSRAEYAHGSAFDNLFIGNAWVNSKGQVITPEEAKVLAFTETVQYRHVGQCDQPAGIPLGHVC